MEGLPKCELTINLSTSVSKGRRPRESTDVGMVKHEEWIEAYGHNESLPSRVNLRKTRTCGDWVTHMSITSSSGVHPIVEGFQTVGLCIVVQY